jgi:hypothetical protein
MLGRTRPEELGRLGFPDRYSGVIDTVIEAVAKLSNEDQPGVAAPVAGVARRLRSLVPNRLSPAILALAHRATDEPESDWPPPPAYLPGDSDFTVARVLEDLR